MNTIRTTVTLEENLHRQLSAQAFSLKKSLSEIINLKLKNVNFSASNGKSETEQDLAVFARLGRKAGNTNWEKLVREERNQ